MYLSKFVFDNTDDIKVRKLIVNAFVREVILYDDEIVITYNFTDSPEHLKLTKKHVTITEKEIEAADKTAISSNTGSYKLYHTAPLKKTTKTVVFFNGFDYPWQEPHRCAVAFGGCLQTLALCSMFVMQ